jgi:DNA-binding NarL/FixJ family response regulator
LPIQREVNVSAGAGSRPTRRQLEVLRAYIEAGSVAGAAWRLEIAESTARQHLSALYRRTNCANAAQAAYLLGRAEVERRGVRDPL